MHLMGRHVMGRHGRTHAGHEHGHEHDHIHSGEVVLDIGENSGGLIVYTLADLRGQEIEVFPVADPTRLTHTDVHERVFNRQAIFTAVFTPLPIGEYRVSRPADQAGHPITISPGTVTELDWR